MSTTCQVIYVRAKQSAPANATLIPTPPEILARIDADQQALFAALASETRDRFQTTATLVSTGGASGRVFDLASLSPPVERVLQLTLSDTREVRQVDALDVDAELSPRYVVRGQQLLEVGNDWSTASGTVSATLLYVYGPTAIVPNQDYSQLVSVPDAFADLLVLPLRKYLAQHRAPVPGDETIDAELQERRQAFAAYLTNYGGIASTRFAIPNPMTGNPKT